MNAIRPEPHETAEATNSPDTGSTDNRIEPLAGEAGIPQVATAGRTPYSKKALLAGALAILSVVSMAGVYGKRLFSDKAPGEHEAKRQGDRPAAAFATPRTLELPARPASSPAFEPTPLRVPALQTDIEPAEPIGIRRSAPGTPMSGPSKGVAPEDAPVLLVSSRPGAFSATVSQPPNANSAGTPIGAGTDPPAPETNDPVAATARNLQAYQQQVQGLINTLTQSTKLALAQQSAPGAGPATGVGTPPTGALIGTPYGVANASAGTSAGSNSAATTGGGLFGGQLPASATPRVLALHLGDRNLTLPKGTAFTCALKTKVISAVSGLVGCQVQRDVYSDNGRVLLVERGSHLDGEYRISSVKPGMVRIPVLWTRIRTPLGVTVDIDSPGTGKLGESGIDGYIDNRWTERLGAAMLMSLIDDSVRLIIQNQANDSGADTIVLPSTTANTSKLAEKVLESTINIPPLIYQNQGGIVGIYVARDVDFSSVYELKPVP